MRLTDFEGIHKQISDALREIVNTDGDDLSVWNVLRVAPCFARDAVINRYLRAALLHPTFGVRRNAALTLAAVGEEEGIIHLTYNSLSIHPLLGDEQFRYKDWSEVVLRFATELTPSCIELLLKDMEGAHPSFHGLSLAHANPAWVFDALQTRLNATSPTSWYAAYSLVWHGFEAAVPKLIEWCRSTDWPRRPFEAVARLAGDPRLKEMLVEFCDSSHRIYRDDTRAGPDNKHRLLPFLHFVRRVTESAAEMPLCEELFSTFGASTSSESAPYLRCYRPDMSMYAPTLIMCLGANRGADLAQCLELQRRGIQRFNASCAYVDDCFYEAKFLPPSVLAPSSIAPTLYGGVQGFMVRYDPADFEFYGTDWILRPLEYALH